MRAFARLYAELDASTSARHKVEALARYLRGAPDEDAAWAVYFLAGGKPRQVIRSRVLREAAAQAAGVPDWLFDESYQAVGDLAETIALLLPAPAEPDTTGLARWMDERLLPLRALPPEDARTRLLQAWSLLDAPGRFLMNKLITGGLRVGVSRQLVTRALAAVAGLDEKLVAQRMIGYCDASRAPQADAYRALLASAEQGTDRPLQPFPFFLAQPLQQPLEALGSRERWLAEWKWDGIRAQLVRRAGEAALWSRGEELITDGFPEITAAAAVLPGAVVLDGELLCWQEGAPQPMPFSALQRRIGRRAPTPKLLREAPVRLVAYDLLELDGRDLRLRPLGERRELLERVVGALAGVPIVVSPLLDGATWENLAALRAVARERGVEGLMLKRADAGYGVGRTRSHRDGDWWKWKVDPLTVDAVLVYAQRGHGRRASLYTDYTFAVWDGPPGAAGRRLVPVAKAYSGLTDDEIRQVDAVIRRSADEKFGPVRSVKPTLVFEIGFEGIVRSPRHRSGVAVRFPRILRWRTDKPVEEADTLAALQRLLPPQAADPARRPAGAA